MNSKKKLLSIIVVSFNTAKLLNLCLESVFHTLTTEKIADNTEVIVVDNNSVDETIAVIKKKYPQVKLIENRKNLGFTKANNQGLRKSQGEFILLINSDTQIRAGSLKFFLKVMEDNSKIGVVGAKLINKDRSIQPSVGFFPSITKVFFWMTFLDDLHFLADIIKPYHVENIKFYQYKKNVDWVSGAFIAVRRKAFETAGLLDEKIFMYGEEVEWCYRIKKHGYRVIYQPLLTVYHAKGGSGIGGDAGILEEIKFIVYFYQKYFPVWQNKIVKYLLLIGVLLRIGVFGIIRRYRQRTNIYAKAFKLVR